MREYNLPQLAGSIALPGDFLQAFLESMLEKSVRRAMRPQGALRFKRILRAACNWRGRAEKLRTAIAKTGVRFVVFAIMLFCNTMVAAQDYRGSAQQRAACTPDAFRLCAGYIPEASKVELCLRQQKSALSEACRSVFEQNTGAVASRSSPKVR